MSLKVAIIEDESHARSELIRKLKNVNPSIVVTDEIVSVEQGIQKVPQLEVDVIFCDIRLSDGLSFEIFEQVSCHIPVIFTTAYDEYALKAFEVNSIDYLLKPIEHDALVNAIDKHQLFSEQVAQSITNAAEFYKSKGTAALRSFFVQEGDKVKVLKIEKVAYFFAEGKYVFLTTWDKKQHLVDYNLSQLIELLDNTLFCKINRQFIIHLDAIADIIPQAKSKLRLTLNPSTKKEVIVSSERSAEVKSWLQGI